METELPKFNMEEKAKIQTAAERLEELKGFELELKRQIEKIENEIQPKNFYASIPKKTCALEVTSYLQLAKKYTLISIACPFVVLIGNIFNNMAGVAAALIFIVPFILYLNKINKDLYRLNTEYNLGLKLMQNKKKV